MPRPDDPRAVEAAARIRAARNYAGYTQQELADRLRVSLATMKRMESGARPISTDELLQVGEATEFPSQFMIHGKAAINGAAIPDEPPVACAQRFGDIERRLAAIDAKLRRLSPAGG